jgi:serine/threonine protein kinase
MGKHDCKGKLQQVITPLEDCDWKLSYEIGRGEDATVYLACCDDVCNYVVKVIGARSSNFFSKVSREISIHEKFSNLGVAPRLIDAYICQKEASLVMEKKDMSVKQYVTLLLQHEVDSEIILTILDEIEAEAIRLLRVTHNAKLVHDDLHTNNIMIDVSDDLEWHNVQFIDFGKSMEVESKQKADKLEPESEITKSLDMLRRTVRQGYMDSKEAPAAPKKERHARSPSKTSAIKMGSFDDEDDDEDEEDEEEEKEEDGIATQLSFDLAGDEDESPKKKYPASPYRSPVSLRSPSSRSPDSLKSPDSLRSPAKSPAKSHNKTAKVARTLFLYDDEE